MKFFIAAVVLAVIVSRIYIIFEIYKSFRSNKFNAIHFRRLPTLNGKFKLQTIWPRIVQNVSHLSKYPQTKWTSTKNSTSPMTIKLSATSSVSLIKWDFSTKRLVSMLNAWWSNWARARTKLSSSQKLRNAQTKIHKSPTLVNGLTVDLTASRRPILTWFRQVWRKTKRITVWWIILCLWWIKGLEQNHLKNCLKWFEIFFKLILFGVE